MVELRPIERLRNERDGSITDDPPTWIRQEVQGPIRFRLRGRDEIRPVGLRDEPERDPDGPTTRSALRLDEEDLPPSGELLADVRGQRPLPCQDLPSV